MIIINYQLKLEKKYLTLLSYIPQLLYNVEEHY